MKPLANLFKYADSLGWWIVTCIAVGAASATQFANGNAAGACAIPFVAALLMWTAREGITDLWTVASLFALVAIFGAVVRVFFHA